MLAKGKIGLLEVEAGMNPSTKNMSHLKGLRVILNLSVTISSKFLSRHMKSQVAFQF
jgi:hypothetical protein